MNYKHITGLLIFLAMFATPAFADMATFSASQVTIIVNTEPNTSFSTLNGNIPDGDRVSIDGFTDDYGDEFGVSQGLLRFTDFSIPLGSTINSATLNFYTKSSTDGPVHFYQLLSNWDNTTTWNTFGGDGITPGVEAAINPFASESDIADETTLSVDATSLVTNWLTQDPFGIGIINPSEDGWDFQIITDGHEFSPELIVDYTPVPLPAGAWLFLSGILGLIFKSRISTKD